MVEQELDEIKTRKSITSYHCTANNLQEKSKDLFSLTSKQSHHSSSTIYARILIGNRIIYETILFFLLIYTKYSSRNVDCDLSLLFNEKLTEYNTKSE